MTWIPSKEDFERADRRMAERLRGLSDVANSTKASFHDRCRIVRMFIYPSNPTIFHTLIFFDKDADIEANRQNGLITDIQKFVYSELERVGRGKRSEIAVAFEYDSDENVDRKYHGDYILRMHAG